MGFGNCKRDGSGEKVMEREAEGREVVSERLVGESGERLVSDRWVWATL